MLKAVLRPTQVDEPFAVLAIRMHERKRPEKTKPSILACPQACEHPKRPQKSENIQDEEDSPKKVKNSEEIQRDPEARTVVRPHQAHLGFARLGLGPQMGIDTWVISHLTLLCSSEGI